MKGYNKLLYYTGQSNIGLSNMIDDSITYSVLKKILQYKCTDIFTNNESIIICYSNPPYPIWVWCKDSNNKDDVRIIADILKNYYFDKGNYVICIDFNLLSALKEIDNFYNEVYIKMELLSYKLTEINPINYNCDGYMRLATIEDLDIVTMIIKDAHYEMEGLVHSIEECKNKAINHISNASLYLWVNNDNEVVATTNTSTDEKYVKLGLVYTLPNQRRKGYAINLVHRVTKQLLDNGLIPILYADGGYIASNECYKKIGYKQVGRLCNITKNRG